MTQPMDTDLMRARLIERYAETFALDLTNPIEADLAAQEADHVLNLIATAHAPAADELLELSARLISVAKKINAAEPTTKTWQHDCGQTVTTNGDVPEGCPQCFTDGIWSTTFQVVTQ